jgi:hypothetical protein
MGETMCDFHLNGQCFNPSILPKGIVAKQCTFLDCSHCTNHSWRNEKINEELETFSELNFKTNNIYVKEPITLMQSISCLK